MEHTSLIENYGNSGIIKGKGTDEIVKRNAKMFWKFSKIVDF